MATIWSPAPTPLPSPDEESHEPSRLAKCKSFFSFSVATALREAIKEGYTLNKFKADLLAGLVVGVVALPLSMALAIGTGVSPQNGLYTCIIGGIIAAALGGSRVNVTGPTAAFIVILDPIVRKNGLAGLLVATVIAGVMEMLLGILRLGGVIKFVPHPVTLGFTTGIAVVIGTLQLKDALGIKVHENPEHFHQKVFVLAKGVPTAQWTAIVVSLSTFLTLMLWPRMKGKAKKLASVVPPPLVGIVVGVSMSLILRAAGFPVDTIDSRFKYKMNGEEHTGIPQLPPVPSLSYFIPDDGNLSFDDVMNLIPAGISIALLGAIESLLCATIADGMTAWKHNPDTELIAQGLANICCPFFGGIAATAALARTATNCRSGAHSPVASIIHCLFVLIAMVAIAPLLGYLPMPALAALLIRVAINMSEYHDFYLLLRRASPGDVMVLMTCFLLTVFIDMVVAISVGMALAAILFIHRITKNSSVKTMVHGQEPTANLSIVWSLPDHIAYYQIQGPMFFGFASTALSTISGVATVTVVIIDLEMVPDIDSTGVINFEKALVRIGDFDIYLCGLNEKVMKSLKRHKIQYPASVKVFNTLDQAVEHAKQQREGFIMDELSVDQEGNEGPVCPGDKPLLGTA